MGRVVGIQLSIYRHSVALPQSSSARCEWQTVNIPLMAGSHYKKND
ncbi:hypothetical protein DES37_110195 [Mangrovibacter plantisponsor]|uniref:Uncharacterized protein n=1 Tax=Mangrovibacter plantisponsor TaxID=451513 RepID=A0A317PVU2_9ENTR|nr:hypothetical protein DES37_110195 [Mangrovibacter plantisponsor]